MTRKITTREIAYCGCFGAAALLLPILFHLIRLGHVFMPMYLPLVLLAFFVRPLPAALTALLTPLISAVVTGMPPFYPPVAILMAIELSTMSALIATMKARWPNWNDIAILVPTLLLGRVLYVAMVYGISLVINLPAGFMAGLSFFSGWPGIVLMIVVIPTVHRTARKRYAATEINSNSLKDIDVDNKDKRINSDRNTYE